MTQLKLPLVDKKTIAIQLKEIGIKPSVTGYECLKAALGKCIEDKSYCKSLTTRLYPDIANEMNSTASRVERAMRYAIGVAWYAGDIHKQHKIFGGTVSIHSGRPTVGEFLATMTDYLLEEEI